MIKWLPKWISECPWILVWHIVALVICRSLSFVWVWKASSSWLSVHSFFYLVDSPLTLLGLSDGAASGSIPPSGQGGGHVTFKLGQAESFSWIFPICLREERGFSGRRVWGMNLELSVASPHSDGGSQSAGGENEGITQGEEGPGEGKGVPVVL